MKVFLSLLLLLPACVSKNNNRGVASDIAMKEKLKSVFQSSVFYGDQKPEKMEITETVYSPILVAAQSSLLSRPGGAIATWYSDQVSRKVKNPEFREYSLPPTGWNSACNKNMSAYYKKGETTEPTFVVIPGSFASWTHRSFNFQTADYLKKIYPKANILSFAGYLSKQTLEKSCDGIPWDGESYARDLRQRILQFLDSQFVDKSKVGVIGYSGGAYLASMMLGLDGEVRPQKRLFSLGGIAFNPVLDSHTTFDNIDKGLNKSQIPFNRHLMSPGWWEGSKNLIQFFNPTGNGRKNLAKKMASSDEFEDLFFNMFHDSLRAIVSKTLGESVAANNEMTYLNVFVNLGFGKDNPSVKKEDWLKRFKIKTNVAPTVEKAVNDLVIIFPQDDPLLSALPGNPQPLAINETIQRLRENPKIIVFNPKYGGHTGALLDRPFWDNLIATFFKEKLKEIRDSENH